MDNVVGFQIYTMKNSNKINLIRLQFISFKKLFDA